MKKSRYSDSQILAILKQAEAGTPIPALCRERVIAESGVSASESSGGLVDCCHLDSIFEFNSRKHFRQVIKTA